ncbi:iron-sulfur cluster assembly scaffold protein [Candidatus Saccharibacteria bacterium]|nr:iron-sulfur cluster assembly scaffold protein [Candidatus Saccharibacteria bacterium]
MSSLYRQVLLERYKNLRHKGTLEQADYSVPSHNPSCGDSLTIDLKIDEQGIVQDASFYGDGCMVSLVSADEVIDHLIGKPIAEIATIDLKQIEQWLGNPLTAGRYNCATLILQPIKTVVRPHKNN